MALMRGFSKVDKEGRITIPKNIRRGADLKEGQLVEIKMQGTPSAHYITIKTRKQAR